MNNSQTNVWNLLKTEHNLSNGTFQNVNFSINYPPKVNNRFSFRFVATIFRFAGYYNVVRNRERPFPIEDEKKEARWYHYKLESESSQEDSEGDESTYSVQGKETGTNVLVLNSYMFR